jgi:ketosteroid isomerase-like protein
MTTEITRQVVQNLLDALKSGNINSVRELFLDDAELIIHFGIPMPKVRVFQGITEIIHGLSLEAGYPLANEERFQMGHFFAADERAAIEWELITDNFGNTPPYKYYTLFEFENNKINRMIVYLDHME